MTRDDRPVWHREEHVQELMLRIKKHLVPIYFKHRLGVNGDLTHAIYSGFLFASGDYRLWVTAAHVVRELYDLDADPMVRDRHLAFADDFDEFAARVVPLDLHTVMRFTPNDPTLDFGFLILHNHYTRLFYANPNVEFLDDNDLIARTDGAVAFYVVGYPQMLHVARTTDLTHGREQGILFPALACIPLTPVDHDADDTPTDFWGDQRSFYFELVSAEPPNRDIEQIGGMSGGPIIAVIQTGDETYEYKLLAVQASWLPGKRAIRAFGFSAALEQMRNEQPADEAADE
jgi:hypothetical protein